MAKRKIWRKIEIIDGLEKRIVEKIIFDKYYNSIHLKTDGNYVNHQEKNVKSYPDHWEDTSVDGKATKSTLTYS